MSHTLTNLVYHAIFSTKDRRPLIVDASRDRLYGYIGGILDHHDGRLIRAGGTADHVHLLFQLAAAKSLAEMMRAVKATSSKWVHETFPDSGEFAWQTGYAAFTVSQSAIPKVAAYIENQEEHHRIQTFDDEYKAFLDRHGIEYDDRLVLG